MTTFLAFLLSTAGRSLFHFTFYIASFCSCLFGLFVALLLFIFSLSFLFILCVSSVSDCSIYSGGAGYHSSFTIHNSSFSWKALSIGIL